MGSEAQYIMAFMEGSLLSFSAASLFRVIFTSNWSLVASRSMARVINHKYQRM